MSHSRLGSRALLAPVVLGALLLAEGDGVARAADWKSSFEGVFLDVFGHDPLVLTILETGGPPPATARTGVALETESKLGYRADLQVRRGTWGLGAEFFWITTGQQLERSASASAAGGDVTFEVGGGAFTSTSPAEALYFRRLEDTDLNAWSFDLYAARQLGGSAERGVEARAGLRVADFDNDHRTAAGIEGVRGLRTDASSNYGAMRGPLLGLKGWTARGRNAFQASIAQSVVFGEAELSNRRRAFTGGGFAEDAPFVSDATFATTRDSAIPMTDLRLVWTYRLTRSIAAGLSATASTWWDVPVPPGVVPAEGAAVALDENTLVFSGVGVVIEISY